MIDMVATVTPPVTVSVISRLTESMVMVTEDQVFRGRAEEG